MTAARYVLGVVLLAIAFVPIGMGALALRRRFLADWRGAIARLVEIVIGLSTTLVVVEALGAVGLYKLAPVVIGLALAGGVELGLARRGADVAAQPDGAAADGSAADGADGERRPRFNGGLGTGGAIATVVVVAVVTAGWAPHVVQAWRQGMTTIDTLWYHMPLAARWVQTGNITAIHYFDNDSVTAFYPANSPLLHGIGIMTLGSDLLSTVMAMGWFALGLVAAWCIGRPYRVGPIAVAGAAILLGTPGLIVTQPGGAYTDVVGLALLLIAAAVIVTAEQQAKPPIAAYAVAGLACGWALGTKYTFVATVGAFTIGVVVIAAKGERVRRALVWIGGLVVTGSFWYFRNLFAVGNPVPSFGAHLGPVTFKNLTINSSAISSVSHFLFNGTAWHVQMLPGLLHAIGPAWWAVVALSGIGMALGLVLGPSRVQRLLAAVAAVSWIAFVFTPQYLQIYGLPVYFEYNLRYLTPGILLALITLPLVVGARWRRLRWPLLGVYGLVLVGTELDPSIWPLGLGDPFTNDLLATGRNSLYGLLIGVAVLVGGLALVAVHRGVRVSHTQRRAAVGVGVVALIVAGAFLRPYYLDHRYAEVKMSIPDFDYTWARDLRDKRIGVLGILQYPMYGTDLSNHVQYLGLEHADGSFSDITDCPTWRRVLNAGHYDYVFLTSILTGHPPAYAWMETDKSVELVSNDPRVYKVVKPSNPATCPPTKAKAKAVAPPP